MAIRIAIPVKKVSLLSSGKEFPFHWNDKIGKLTISDFPALPSDAFCSILKVNFESVPERRKEADLAVWLEE